MIKKIVLGLLALLAVLVAAALGGLYYIGAWNLVFENRQHETVPPELPASLARPAILLFTKTNGFRHTEAIAAGSAFIKRLAERRGWSVFHTENGAVFNAAQLAAFDVVMFHNTSGDTLNSEQESSFQAWLEGGGGWVGTHAAGDGSHADWEWYADKLIGVEYNAHIMDPQFQVATLINEAPTHPSTLNLPATWQHEEEWYSWKESPRGKGFTVLISVDESTYDPWMHFLGESRDLRMGDHPIVWSRCIGQGRALYSALGHQAKAFDDATHQQLLEQALSWAMQADACAEGQD